MTARKPKPQATAFAGNRNPWTGEDARPRRAPAKTRREVDLSAITVTDAPYEPRRQVTGSKYDTLFGALRVGQCMEAPPEHIDALRNGLVKWMEVRGWVIDVREHRRCDDGKGRLWLMARRPAIGQPQTPLASDAPTAPATHTTTVQALRRKAA